MTPGTFEEFRVEYAALVERLHRQVGAHRWKLQPAAFAEALFRSLSAYARSRNPGVPDVAGYLESLHLDDLALARACELASEPAWEHFMREFRPRLYAAATAIAGAAAARELADSLYGDLYGLDERADTRRSLFRYFHGRSSLATWLRAVLAQRHVDAVRAGVRTTSLPDHETALGSTPAVDPDPDRERYLDLLRDVLRTALGQLDDQERLRLSLYYTQDLTLAHIGRLLGEHEATTSRKLTRTRRMIRVEVDRLLRERHGLGEEQIRLCCEYAVEEWPYDLGAALEVRP